MIDIQAQYIQDYLDNVNLRVLELAEAFSWLEGTQIPDWSNLLPNVQTNSTKATDALNRYCAQIQSVGPRAFSSKLSGAIGSVNWDSDSTEVDDRLRELDLMAIAQRIFKELFVAGICSVRSFVNQKNEQLEMEILGGYLEPIYPEYDQGGQVIGLYQVLQSTDDQIVKYNINVYDFQTNTIQHWFAKDNAYEMGALPDEVSENQPMPILSITRRTDEGYPNGDFLTAVPLVKSEYVQQLKTIRVSETHAFASTYFKGPWRAAEEIGPHISYKSNDAGWQDAEIGRVQAGDMEPQFKMASESLERVRATLSLPVNFSGNQVISGLALEQINIAYTTSNQDYAERTGSLLTKGTQQYAELLGIANSEDILVSVSPNRQYLKNETLDDIIKLYEAGLMPLEVAATEIQPFFGTWSDAEMERFLNQSTNQNGEVSE